MRGGGSAGITNRRLPVFLTGADALARCGWMSWPPNGDVPAERDVQEPGKSEIRGGGKLALRVSKETQLLHPVPLVYLALIGSCCSEEKSH